jgi:hypothetical protein
MSALNNKTVIRVNRAISNNDIEYLSKVRNDILEYHKKNNWLSFGDRKLLGVINEVLSSKYRSNVIILDNYRKKTRVIVPVNDGTLF